MKNGKIELDILWNPLRENSKYQKSYNDKEIQELIMKSKELEEFNTKKKNFFYKEKILYNTLPNEHFQKINLDSTNLFSFENYFKQEEDFDCQNFENLMNMRKKYIENIFSKEKENEGEMEEQKEDEEIIKESTEINEENKKEKEKENIEDFYSLLNDLKDMLENFKIIKTNGKNEDDLLLYFSIIEKIFGNIFFELETFFKKRDFNTLSKYEQKLSESVDSFENIFLPPENNNELINDKRTIYILYQLQKLSLTINSCGVFLKILNLMKKNNILFDNYNDLYKKYFKFNLSEAFKQNEEISLKVLDITLDEEASNVEFFIEEKYLYLCYNNKKKSYLIKYDIENKKKILEKNTLDADDISILNDKKNNKIKLLIYIGSIFKLLIINKNDLEIEKEYKIKQPKLGNNEEFKLTQIMNSLNYFYILVKDRIYSLNLQNEANLEFELFLKYVAYIPINKLFFYVLDDYIFLGRNNYIDLHKKKIYGNLEEENKENKREFFEYNKEVKYSIDFKQRKKEMTIELNQIIYNKNKILMITENNNIINATEEKIENIMGDLNHSFIKKEEANKEKKKLDVFDYYLNYNNDFDLILKSENDMDNYNYKIDEILSNKYYELFYNALINFYIFSSGKGLVKNDKLVMNINNNIIFDEIKGIIKEKKDYLLLYIYTYFLTLYGKNKDVNKNIIDSQIKSILDIVINLTKENSSTHLFYILREIYKFKPEYMNDSYISENLLYKSDKLNLNETIYNYSFISLNGNKNFEILLKNFLQIEKKIILLIGNDLTYDKKIYNEVCQNFLNYFLNKNSYQFTEDNFWEKFEKIFIILIENYNALLYEYNQFITSSEKWLEIKEDTKFVGLIKGVVDKKINLLNGIKKSVVVQCLFILINVLFFQINYISEKNKDKIIKILKLLLKSAYVTNNIKEIDKKEIEEKKNSSDEEIIIINSDNLDLNKEFEIALPYYPSNKNLDKLYLEFDFETNYENKLRIGTLQPLINRQSFFEIHELKNVNNYDNGIIMNEFKDNNNNINKSQYQRFKLKFANFKSDEYNTYSNILINIRKSILSCIIKLSLDCSIKNKNITQNEIADKNIDKISDKKIKEIISNEFFNNISILDKEENSINIENKFDKFLSVEFKDILDNKNINETQKDYDILCKDINSMFIDESSKENSINININITSFNKMLTSNESYKKLIEKIHQEFIKKNIWGTMSDSLLRNIIISCFAIIISDFDLIKNFEDLVALLQKDEKALNENAQFKQFVMIYTKINNLKKIFSTKKHEFSLAKDKNEKEEELLLKKYMEEMNSKLDFILTNKKIQKNKLIPKSRSIEETIIFLLEFISNEKITKNIVIEKIQELNTKAKNKINSLDCLNKMLFISDKIQDIKNIIYSINSLIKDGKNKFKNYLKDLIGADRTLLQKYQRQIYLYLNQIIQRIKSDKNKYDITYYFTLLNSLFYPYNESDIEFLIKSKMYEILLSPGNKFYNLLHDLNSRDYNVINMEKNNVYKINEETLLNKVFELFKLMTFIGTNNIKSGKNIPLIKYVFDFIFDILNKYNEDMDKLKKEKIESKEILNEEKLNHFLLIFYRCILNKKTSKEISDFLQNCYKNIFSVFFNIFIYSSMKNKILAIKIISILLFDNELYINDIYIKNDNENFKNEIKTRNVLLYNLINSSKVNHIENIFIELIFNLILLLQQNIDNSINYINGTENNFALSFILIKTLQKKLKKNDNSKIWQEIYKFIELNYSNKKYLSIILQILGVEFDYIYIGSNFNRVEKKDIGIIIGFNNAIIKEDFNNDEFVYKDINYSNGNNLIYINKEDIANPDNFNNSDFTLEIIQKYNNSQDINIIKNNKLILSKEKNEPIYTNLLKNISQFEPKEIYLILKYLKIILLQEKINLDENIISILANKSLDKEVLQMHCKIINIELLEKFSINKLCEVSQNILVDIVEKKSEEKETNIDTKTEEIFVDPLSEDILCLSNSLVYRFFERNLGYNISYKKIINHDLFNESKNFLKLFKSEDNCKNYKNDCILFTKDIFNLKKLSPNIKYIIIPDMDDENFKNIKILSIPIIVLDKLDFKNLYEHAFDKIPFPEAENLFEKNITFDISSLFEIPFERVPEFLENQRDVILEILNVEANYYEPKQAPINMGRLSRNDDDNSNNSLDENEKEKDENNNDFYKKIFCGKSYQENYDIIFKKLIAQISRRILLITKIIGQKIGLGVGPNILKKVVKLLCYETLSENCSMVENKNYEIYQLIKNFILHTSLNNEFDIIKEFTDLSFLESDKLITDKTAKSKETEEELLNLENLNNNILLINMFFLTENAKDKNKCDILNQKYLFDYISKLINQDLNLVISFLVTIFKYIEKNMDEYKDILYQYKNMFNCDEFKEMFNSCENLIKEKLNISEDNDNKKLNENIYEKIELIFSFINIDCIMKYKYGINLDIAYLNNIENSSLLSIHTILAILLNLKDNDKSNNEINYYNFIELCYQKNLYKYLINNEQFSKPLKKYKFNYYDKNFDSNFVTNYQNIIPKNLEKDINNISLILKSVDNKIINPDNCVFIYESEKCNFLQDYIKIKDEINDKRVNLISDNFTISYPNKNFKCKLYGSGSNEKNSLGIQEPTGDKYHWEPHICVGLEECKNILDFKFGYFHSFIQSADGNLFTCGCDKGSSFKFNTEFSYFNKQTYFQSLSKENEGIKIISANNFNSSILLTNNNKLFCCGKNSAFCLGKAIKQEGEEIDIPRQMPGLLPLIKEINYPYKIKEISCGYKSTLFLLEEGYAFTCGSQDFKQCGSKEKVPYYQEYFPLYPPRGTRFIHAVAGEEFFLLLVEEIKECGYGKLYSLGQNEFGRSGAGELNINYSLQKLEAVEDKDFFVIASRNENSAAISTEGVLYTFGYNNSCALGLGDEKNRFVPTRVSTLEEYYFCDNVGISQNHMVVIAREKKTGKRVVLTCGDNKDKALCINNEDKNKFDIPTKIFYFDEKKPNDEPIRSSLSRFQTYIMTIKVDLKENINKIWKEFACKECKKEIQYTLFFDFGKNSSVNYYCKECALKNNKNIFFVINTINSDTKTNIEKILEQKNNIKDITEIQFEKNTDKFICTNCNNEIIKNTNIYQSYSNEKLILCEKCYMSKCCLIEYPQVFLSHDINIKPQIKNKIELDKIIYPNIIKTEKPYLEFDLVANYKKEYIIKELYQNKELRKLYDDIWKMINENILVEMRKLKEFYDDNKFDYLFETKKEKKEEKNESKEKEENIKEKHEEINEIIEEITDIVKEEKKGEEKKEPKEETDEDRLKLMQGKNYENLANIAGKSNKYYLFEIIKKLLDLRNSTNIKNSDFANLDLYVKNPTFYSLAFSLSNFINFQILKILSLSLQFPSTNNLFNKVLESSLKLITSQERKEIFLKNLEKNKISVNFEDEEISISRIKANVFYKKNILDRDLQYTVFSQLFRKTRGYPLKNYLCKINNRLFKIRLIGEGATDFSGVYNEVISIISFELESKYLDLFIKTPNNKNEIGALRDKFMPNPRAMGKMKNDMYYFLGNLMLHSISSGNVLNLNLHPIFYKKLLNKEVDFSEIETLDKLSYKFINNLENIKTEEEFNNLHDDLYFVVHSSGDDSLVDLVENGQNKKVTFQNLPEYINLYKKFLLTEYDNQISIIHSGLFGLLSKLAQKNFMFLITPQDLEEFITGEPKLDLQLLREKTIYDSYEPNSKLIQDFWKVLESFTEEERSLYLKFVSGRSRLPDARSINFFHKIQKLNKRNPDDYMPVSTTCYFTISLPNYSSYEILRDKLRYAIHNCNSIDADFVPVEGAGEFDE